MDVDLQNWFSKCIIDNNSTIENTEVLIFENWYIDDGFYNESAAYNYDGFF